MIVEAILNTIAGLLVELLEAIPDLTLPVGTYPEDFAEALGGALGGLDGVLPISELALVTAWILTVYVPVVFAYSMARWVYTHLPIIGNGG